MQADTKSMAKHDSLDDRVYALICQSDGVKARDIAVQLGVDRSAVNRCLYTSPFIHDLCYRDENYLWYGVIQQRYPHVGLGEYCGWYSTVGEFLETSPAEWLTTLEDNCRRIGRNLNDTRGLYHSFRDTEQVMRELFAYLQGFESLACDNWEVAFEVRIKCGRHVRIYADVLVITQDCAFSLEFKMKNAPDPGELDQAVKYAPYLQTILGPSYKVIPALVLTRATDVYESQAVAICSADMLFNVFDQQLGFLDS